MAYIASDFASNYFWPNYTLPWNNFFSRIRNEPYYTENRLRNQTAREVASPLVFDSQPLFLVSPYDASTCVSKLPSLVSLNPLSGTSLIASAIKSFVGKAVSRDPLYYSLRYNYHFTGTLSCVGPISGEVWLIFELNLARSTNNSLQSVSIGSCPTDECKCGILVPKSIVQFTGGIVVGSLAVTIENPTNVTTCTTAKDTNTLYQINGNKITIAIYVNATSPTTASQVNYDFNVDIDETPRNDAALSLLL